GQRPHLLTRDTERLAAGSQHTHTRTIAEETFGEPTDGGDDVLAIVEQQDELARAERVEHARRECARRARQHAEGGSDDLRELLVVLCRGEVAQPRAVGKAAGDVERDLNRDTALADTTDPRHGDEPRREQVVADRLPFAVSPSQRP